MSRTTSSAPRIRVVRESLKSYGLEAFDLARRAGLELYGYQRDALIDVMAVDEDDQWTHFEAGLSMPRQNGKGAIAEALELWHLFKGGTRLIIHSAHEFKTAELHFHRLQALVQNSPELSARVRSIKSSHGQEGFYLSDGSSLRFYTRTKSGTRGFSAGLVVMDEAMVITEAAHGAMMPTLRAATRDKAPHGPQLVYAGSAVDQTVHEYGVVWARVRERGIAADDPSLAFLEWSIEAEHPLDVTDAIAADVEQWAIANPGLGELIAVDHMRREHRSMTPRTFAVELLGAGDWPDTEGTGTTVVELERWLDLTDELAVLVDPVVLSFDVSPSRRSSISAAGKSDREGLLVELVESREGTAWVADRLVELSKSHDVVELVCDGYGPAVSIAAQVEEAGLRVRRLDTGEHGQACGRFVDAVGGGTLRHLGQEELTLAIKGAKPRPLGDAWAWSRKNSVVDISPLVASSFALSSAVELDLARGRRVQIF